MTALRNASAQKAPLFSALMKCVGLVKSVAFQTTAVDATGVSQPLSHCLWCYEVLTNFKGHYWVRDSCKSVQKKTMQGILFWCFTGETVFLSLIHVVRYKKHAKIQGMCSIRSQCNLSKHSSIQGWIIWESSVSPFFPGGPCMPDPCKNDGICSETSNSTSLHFCECSELYTGQNCEAEKIGNKNILYFPVCINTSHHFQKHIVFKNVVMEKTGLALNFHHVG